jgi:hypothetical protein
VTNLPAFLLSLAIVGVVFEMLRRKKLREKYAALWLIVGVGTLVLAAFPRLLTIVAELVGVQLPSNLLFIISTLLLLGVSLHLSWEISVVEDETRTLAEEVAILRAMVEDMSAQDCDGDAPALPSSPSSPTSPTSK